MNDLKEQGGGSWSWKRLKMTQIEVEVRYGMLQLLAYWQPTDDSNWIG
jgi:hypothetical protein